MGSWFTNLHIRSAGLTMDPVIRAVSARLEEQGFVPAEPSEADGTVAILPPEQGGWYSVYSDLWSFEDPSRFSALAEPLSRSLSGEVLGIGCFDSDYLYLNLIDAGSGTDAWLGVGSPAPFGIRRRTGWSAWKNGYRSRPASGRPGPGAISAPRRLWSPWGSSWGFRCAGAARAWSIWRNWG